MTRYIWDKPQGKFVEPSQATHVEPAKRSHLASPMLMSGMEAYTAPVSNGDGSHSVIRSRKEQSRLMNEHDAVDSRDVPTAMYNENVKEARGYGD